MTVAEIQAEISRLGPGDRAEILARLTHQIGGDWPGIERIAGVVGGEACIVRTRIAVWMLENYRRLGLTDAQILAAYPALRAADLVNAWAYADSHRDEIDRVILENETV